MDFVSCCNQRAPNPNFSRVTLQLIRENKERLLNSLNDLAEPIAEKVDNVIGAIPNAIGTNTNIGPLGGESDLNNVLNSLGLGSLGGFLPGQNVIDFVTALNGWKNMSLDARALADIFSKGVFVPFGNFSVGLNTGKTTTAPPKTTEKCVPTTPKPSTTTAPVKPCQCGSNPCTCNKIPKEPCQCGSNPCTCSKIPKEPCKCGSNPCTCNKIVKEPNLPCENSEEIKYEAVGSLLTYLMKKASTDNCS